MKVLDRRVDPEELVVAGDDLDQPTGPFSSVGLDEPRITLTDPDLRATVKKHCWSKYSRPSMLQHIDAGKRTEIDNLNAKLVEEGRRLGIPTPYNDALVMLLKGVEHKATVARGRTEADYHRLEAEVVGTSRSK